MKIVTLNLKGFDARPRRERLQEAACRLAQAAPDIILLQEGVGGLVPWTWCSIRDLARYLEGWGLRAEDGGHLHCQSANMAGWPLLVTYRLGIIARQPLENLGVAPLHNGPHLEWEGLMPWRRQVLGCHQLVLRFGGVAIYTTHFGGGSPAGSLQQMGEALKFISQSGPSPVIFGGDFNFRQGPAHDLVIQNGFQLLAAQGVDRIYGRGLKSWGARVLFYDPAISDHPAVMASIS